MSIKHIKLLEGLAVKVEELTSHIEKLEAELKTLKDSKRGRKTSNSSN